MVNVLNATELFRLKWLILCYMKKVESSEEAVREPGSRLRGSMEDQLTKA